jgi:hypothetical protein
MRKLMCGKIVSILLALIVVALSASGAVACTDKKVEACGSCDNICDTGGACGTGVGTCGDVFFGTCGNDVGKCGNVFFGTLGNDVGKCDAFSKEANVPTWEELVLALEHDGFESWSGINFSGLSNL